jgi:hypothetical protein
MVQKARSVTKHLHNLVHLIQFVHDQKLKVMLKPHIDISDCEKRWRGDIRFEMKRPGWPGLRVIPTLLAIMQH